MANEIDISKQVGFAVLGPTPDRLVVAKQVGFAVLGPASGKWIAYPTLVACCRTTDATFIERPRLLMKFALPAITAAQLTSAKLKFNLDALLGFAVVHVNVCTDTAWLATDSAANFDALMALDFGTDFAVVDLSVGAHEIDVTGDLTAGIKWELANAQTETTVALECSPLTLATKGVDTVKKLGSETDSDWLTFSAPYLEIAYTEGGVTVFPQYRATVMVGGV